jgi:hypothetical protein
MRPQRASPGNTLDLFTRLKAKFMFKRNYWVYSVGSFLVWGVLIALSAARGKGGTFHDVLLVFAGWTICWVSASIARLVYPPPKRWLQRTESSVQ